MAGKGFNAKAFLVNHTEKVIFGIVAAMALLFIGSAQWSPYKGTPEEIIEKVAKGKENLKNHTWPEEDRKKYELVQAKLPSQQVHDTLLTPISAQEYAFNTRFLISPWQGKEPLRDPTLLTLQKAIASAGKVLIERPGIPSSTFPGADHTDPSDSNTPSVNPGPGNPSETPAGDENDEFAADSNLNPGPGGPAGIPNIGSGLMLGGDKGNNMPAGLPQVGRPGGRKPTQKGIPKRNNKQGDDDPQGGVMPVLPGGGLMLGGNGDREESGLGYTAAAVREAQPYKFAIVRAVFPVKEQIALYMKATNSPTLEAASQLFEVIDFNLERQEQVGRSDQWTEWEPVDTKAALDVLEQSAQPEADVVRAAVTDSAITMPLPPRIYGRWGKIASHPSIIDFELSPQEIEQEVKLNAELLKMKEEQEKTLAKEAAPKVQKRGFSSVASDARALQTQMLGGGMNDGEMGFGRGLNMARGGMGDYDDDKKGRGNRRGGLPNMPGVNNGRNPQALHAELMKRLGDSKDETEKNKALEEFIKKSVTAEGELLLFRYLDFNVDPGKTYRYRVRLILNNPNFGHLTSEANGEASVVAGETRETDWSNVTQPVTIERDVYYFVKDIDTRRNKTLMSVYEWDTKLGTTVHADLEMYPGQHISGKAKTNVIDPAKSMAEVKEYTFNSPDVFVDMHPDVSLDRNLHKDLRLPGGSNGDALLPEEALILETQAGELTVIDPVREASEQSRLAKQQKSQDDYFAWMSQPVGGVGGDLSDLQGDGEGGFGGLMGGGRLRNPLSAQGEGRGGRPKKNKGDD